MKNGVVEYSPVIKDIKFAFADEAKLENPIVFGTNVNETP